jgi:hypothetical protein
MNAFRLGFSLLVTIALAAGYLASQLYYWRGQAKDYALWANDPAIATLAAIILLMAAGLAFVRDKYSGRDSP